MRTHLARRWADPEPQHSVADDDEHHRAKCQRDGAEPGDELAVDHLVAMDRLRHESRQRALRAFAVDGIEAERDAEQRTENCDELVEGRYAIGCQA